MSIRTDQRAEDKLYSWLQSAVEDGLLVEFMKVTESPLPTVSEVAKLKCIVLH